jgi:hypothetical protein
LVTTTSQAPPSALAPLSSLGLESVDCVLVLLGDPLVELLEQAVAAKHPIAKAQALRIRMTNDSADHVPRNMAYFIGDLRSSGQATLSRARLAGHATVCALKARKSITST